MTDGNATSSREAERSTSRLWLVIVILGLLLFLSGALHLLVRLSG